MLDDVAVSTTEPSTRDTSSSVAIVIDETIFDDTAFPDGFSRSAEVVLHS